MWISYIAYHLLCSARLACRISTINVVVPSFCFLYALRAQDFYYQCRSPSLCALRGQDFYCQCGCSLLIRSARAGFLLSMSLTLFVRSARKNYNKNAINSSFIAFWRVRAGISVFNIVAPYLVRLRALRSQELQNQCCSTLLRSARCSRRTSIINFIASFCALCASCARRIYNINVVHSAEWGLRHCHCNSCARRAQKEELRNS